MCVCVCVCARAITDINASKMVSIPAEKLPSYVTELHRDNCFNAEEEYEVYRSLSLSLSFTHSFIHTHNANTQYYCTNTLTHIDKHLFTLPTQSIKENDPEFSKHAASQDCNEIKNRYINILPRK